MEPLLCPFWNSIVWPQITYNTVRLKGHYLLLNWVVSMVGLLTRVASTPDILSSKFRIIYDNCVAESIWNIAGQCLVKALHGFDFEYISEMVWW